VAGDFSARAELQRERQLIGGRSVEGRVSELGAGRELVPVFVPIIAVLAASAFFLIRPPDAEHNRKLLLSIFGDGRLFRLVTIISLEMWAIVLLLLFIWAAFVPRRA
jgi:hypothetical protein